MLKQRYYNFALISISIIIPTFYLYKRYIKKSIKQEQIDSEIEIIT